MEFLGGTSGGWDEHWVGKFYSPDIEKREWFSHYAKVFDTVEVNSSFYRLPFAAVVKSWERKAPHGFRFTLKMWRRVTHFKKLKDVADDLSMFFERIEPLRKNLGAILYQLPPSLKLDLPLLEEFLQILPKDLDQAVEFRNESWLTAKTFSLLSKYNKAYCIVSMPKLPEICETTAGFSYVRFHGKEGLYESFYSDDELRQWARRIRGFSTRKVKRVYVYFNNDYDAYAVANASKLREFLTGMTGRK